MYSPRKLYWEEKLSTGDDNLDFQHKYLFETFNKLGDALMARHGKEAVSAIISRLKFYADWHFGKEEECMAKYACPAAQANKTAHAAFMDMFARYFEEYEQTGGSEELAIQIHESLSEWFVNHVGAIDTKLHPCIHKK